ncbi:MAG: carboxyl transferase [Ruminococcus sp.]|nr:carboxyl transferase [Ruminococcus sp.]
MSIDSITQAKASISETAAYRTLSAFFDNGEFAPIANLAKSNDTYAEVVAGRGYVNDESVLAFAQNPDFCGGAMSKAQASKLLKIYDLALKTGTPVVGFYNSKGGRLDEGNAMLNGFGEVLNAASKLSGVVPQVSVILGDCIGTGALNAVSADFVIATKDSRLSLDTTGKNSDIEYNAKNGIVNIVADDEDEAIEKTRQLLTYLPSSNLDAALWTEFEEIAPDVDGCLVKKTFDGDSVYKLTMDYGDNVRTVFASLEGRVQGIVRTKGGKLSEADANKIAKFVRFCDAFSLPVVTFVDADGFEDIKSAAKVSSAYAEATTVKISVVIGKAIGSAYIALAGSGANADMVYAFPEAVISPVNPEAAILIADPDKLNVPVEEQTGVVEAYAKENLGAEKAAENGYVDDVIAEDDLREVLIAANAMLGGKRVKTEAKKHSTI